MDLREYLARIGYTGEVSPTADVLRDLHRQHMYAVPFENLDIPLGREIVLDLERIYDKIVCKRRGGFCYEHNGLFAWVLREIGFEVAMLSAGVAHQGGGFGPDFDHMLLLVRAEGESWIADVGFGDSFVEPLRFHVDAVQAERGWEYQIVRDGNMYVLRRGRDAQGWKDQYRFTLTARELKDYSATCVRHQTSPESHFTQNRICSRATPTGRVTLTQTALIVTANGNRTEIPVDSVAEFERVLKESFGIVLTGFPALGG